LQKIIVPTKKGEAVNLDFLTSSGRALCYIKALCSFIIKEHPGDSIITPELLKLTVFQKQTKPQQNLYINYK
jgi:hypothetical protein